MNTLDLTLYKLNEAQYMLNEGLIRTTDIQTTMRLLHTFAGKHHNIVVSTKEIEWPGSGPNNGLTVNIGGIDNQADVITYKQIIQLLDNLGWFPSFISFPSGTKYSEKTALRIIDTYQGIILVVEAKFDTEVALKDERIKNNKLYHVTLSAHVPKIKKIGLVPKAHGKIADHPDRVYLALTKQAALSMAEMFGRLSGEGKTLLEIDVTDLPDFIKLYSDPNYFKLGVYTLNNIPPHCIVDYKEL